MTSVMLGMRLRVKSDTDNAEKLLDTLPLLTDAGTEVELAFDRGYGKLGRVESTAARNLHVLTVAGTLGSRHPFITGEEWRAALGKWQKKPNITGDQIAQWTQLCEPWIVESDEMLGTEVRIAQKRQSRLKTIFAVALREVFDRKEPMKDLKFFSTKNFRPHTYVGIPMKQRLESTVLFSPAKKDSLPAVVEAHLLLTCEPLTVGQKCADWFLMKSMVISGTMASKIVARVLEDTSPPDEATLQRLLMECLSSWFSRHRSSNDMATGSQNEIPTVERLKSTEEFIEAIYDVGLIRCRKNHAIAVSPDGICVLSLEGVQEPVLACLEIKTRVADATIDGAEVARRKHGRLVHCTYDDEVFKECVPAANRRQVLHQAFVTEFSHGLFVTSKVEDGEGSIIQVVVFQISRETRERYGEVLTSIVNPLLGWLHQDAVRTAGCLVNSDFPEWVPEKGRHVLKSRARLYYAHLKHITMDNGNIQPTQPLLLYKHSIQYRYNKSKPGLDMNTEISDLVRLSSKGLFESTGKVNDEEKSKPVKCQIWRGLPKKCWEGSN